jgi:phosphoribosylformimino-5-aminoimidazole carboxamide ribotide isomerase
VQIGGGLRDLDTIERYLDGGISYVIIGTAAVKNPGFLHDACSAFPGQVIVGLDARDGKVATDGWSKLTGHDVLDLAKKFEGYGVESVIYTDIGRDGMLSGVNIEATVRLARGLSVPVIASGGVAGLGDIDALCAVEHEGVEAAIVGRAIYDGTLDFVAAHLKSLGVETFGDVGGPGTTEGATDAIVIDRHPPFCQVPLVPCRYDNVHRFTPTANDEQWVSA